mgnify:CR=1 FL=1
MSENTIDPNMPRETTPLTVHEDHHLKLKLYGADHKLAHDIQADAAVLFRGLTLQEILRDAIHAGLPSVQKKYRAAVEAALKAK